MRFLIVVALLSVFTKLNLAFQAGKGNPNLFFSFYTHKDIENLAFSNYSKAGRRTDSPEYSHITKGDLKSIYFGNWLRDFSQINDVIFRKYISSDALLRIVQWLAHREGFNQSKPVYRITPHLLGVYSPAEHVDNPALLKTDVRDLIKEFRPPVLPEEYTYDSVSAQKRYIQYQPNRILKKHTTISAIRRRLRSSAMSMREATKLYRRKRHTEAEAKRHKALVELGAALHSIEDFYAHSNAIELGLIYFMRKSTVFPWVGSRSMDDSYIEQEDKYGSRQVLRTIKTYFSGNRPLFPLTTGTHDSESGVSLLLSLYGTVRAALSGALSPQYNFLRRKLTLPVAKNGFGKSKIYIDAMFQRLDDETARAMASGEALFRENSQVNRLTKRTRYSKIGRADMASSWRRHPVNESDNHPAVEEKVAHSYGTLSSSDSHSSFIDTIAQLNRIGAPSSVSSGKSDSFTRSKALNMAPRTNTIPTGESFLDDEAVEMVPRFLDGTHSIGQGEADKTDMLDEALDEFSSKEFSFDTIPEAGPGILKGFRKEYLLVPMSTLDVIDRLYDSALDTNYRIRRETCWDNDFCQYVYHPYVHFLPENNELLADISEPVSEVNSDSEFKEAMSSHWPGQQQYPLIDTWSHYVEQWIVSPFMKWLGYRIAASKIDDMSFFDNIDKKDVTHALLSKDFPDHPFHELAARSAAIAVGLVLDEIELVWSEKNTEHEFEYLFNGMMTMISHFFSHPFFAKKSYLSGRVFYRAIEELYYVDNSSKNEAFLNKAIFLSSRKSCLELRNRLY